MDKNFVRTNLYLAYMLFYNGYKQDRVILYIGYCLYPL